MGVGDVFALVIMFGLLGFGVYLFWTYYVPGESIVFRPVPADVTSQQPVPSKIQFYPQMRYPDNEITYRIDSACNDAKRADVEEAMQILSSETVLRFKALADKPELEITCSNVAPEANQQNHFIAGEGGPTSIINASSYFVILGGKISLFRSEACDEPKVAIHEILHALGFDHNTNTDSIMYPVTNCRQDLDQYIIDAINELYAMPSAPDLSITEVNATKAGRYLSFHIGVANHGLQDADDVNLTVLADDDIVREFQLEDISIGTRKTLDVRNIRIPADTEQVTFFVATKNRDAELSAKNNRADLVIAS